MLIVGFNEQGVDLISKALTHICSYENLKIKELKQFLEHPYLNELMVAEFIHMRIGEGVFSAKTTVNSVDIAIILDYGFVPIISQYVKEKGSYIIISDITCMSMNISWIKSIKNTILPKIKDSKNIYILHLSKILNTYGKDFPEHPRILQSIAFISAIFKLAILPIEKSSYLIGIKALTNNEHIINVAKKILMEFNNYFSEGIVEG